MTTKHHYSYGSGMVGCLYDYGPHYSWKRSHAISDLVEVFREALARGEEKRMRRNLRVDGIHYFEHARDAGADYCEVTQHPGPCPEESES